MSKILPNTLKETVRELLHAVPSLRDDDRKLFTSIILRHIGGVKMTRMTAIDLMEMIERGELPHFESVRRLRQLIQEADPKTRGRQYERRHRELQEEVRAEVRSFNL